MPAKVADPQEFGTREYPLFFSPNGWEQIHRFLKLNMRHVHTFDGLTFECVRNTLGELCLPLTLPDWNMACERPGCVRPAVKWDAQTEWYLCGEHLR